MPRGDTLTPLVATARSPKTTLPFYNPAHVASLRGWELQPGGGAQPGSGTGGQVPTRPGQAATADPGCSGPGRAPQAQTARWPQTFLPVQCLLRTPQPTVHVTAFLPTARPAPPGPAGTTVSWYERKSSGTQQHKVTGMADSMTRTCPQLPLFGTIRPRGGPQAEGLHSDLQLCAERASTLTAWGVRGTRPGVHSISPAFHVDASPTSSATERDHDRKAAVTANPQGPCRRGRHCSPGRWRC